MNSQIEPEPINYNTTIRPRIVSRLDRIKNKLFFKRLINYYRLSSLKLLEEKISIFSLDELSDLSYSRTPLILSINFLAYNFEVMEKLINTMLDIATNEELKISHQNYEGKNAFMGLLQDFYNNRQNNLIKRFISRFTAEELGLSKVDNDGMTAFMYCCKNNCSDLVLTMLNKYSKDDLLINHINNKGETAFMLCCLYQTPDVILTMIDRFDKNELLINHINNKDETAFMLCCINQSQDIILKMIDRFDKDILIKSDKYGRTAFMYCCLYQTPDVILKMIDRFDKNKLLLDYADECGVTAFIYCCVHQTLNVILKLMEKFTLEDLNITSKIKPILLNNMDLANILNLENFTALSLLVKYRKKKIFDQVYQKLSNNDLVYLHISNSI
jgi:ankyrin repeat protein